MEDHEIENLINRKFWKLESTIKDATKELREDIENLLTNIDERVRTLEKKARVFPTDR